MPFDWLHPKKSVAFAEKISGRFAEMHVREIEQRARLLNNLKFDRDRSIRRIQDNIAWEFELSVIPSFYKDVPTIVDRVYRREG